VIIPEVVMHPILLPPDSVNQSAPSVPAVIRAGLSTAGREFSLMTPAEVIRPILHVEGSRSPYAKSATF